MGSACCCHDDNVVAEDDVEAIEREAPRRRIRSEFVWNRKVEASGGMALETTREAVSDSVIGDS